MTTAGYGDLWPLRYFRHTQATTPTADYPSGALRLLAGSGRVAPRLFQQAKPFKQAVFVPIDPALDDLAVFETVDRNARPGYCFF